MEKPAVKSSARKTTETAKKVRSLLKASYIGSHEAKKQGKPVAYVMGSTMVEEIAQAMGIHLIYTENYATLCAAKQQSNRFLEKSDMEGYSNLLCGYARTGIGFDAMRKELGAIPDAPDGGMARPDMLLCSTVWCATRYAWYRALGRYLDVPMYCMEFIYPPKDMPVKNSQPDDYYIEYQVEALKGMVAFIEKHTGTRMDWDKLNYHIDLANKMEELWWQVSEMRKAVPCPMGTNDEFAVMYPFIFMKGSQEALDVAQQLYDEVKHRVDNGIGAIPEEKFRLMWARGIPPWYATGILNYFEEYGGVLVIEDMYRSFTPADRMGIPRNIHPLERIARRWHGQMVELYESARKGCGDPAAQYYLDRIDSYKLDGIVEHQVFSCHFRGIGQLHNLNVIKEHRDIPILHLTGGDMIDPSGHSDADIRRNIEAFMEIVRNHKNKKGGGPSRGGKHR